MRKLLFFVLIESVPCHLTLRFIIPQEWTISSSCKDAVRLELFSSQPYFVTLITNSLYTTVFEMESFICS